ncbi:MAG: hypothetical protein AB1806_04225 [Acidobacteriota bacterium]
MVDASQPDTGSGSRAEVDERDAKVDELLLRGLEHYFEGRYDEAINVWGRVLFLDRGHARARAYIERARSATAEQQRRSDELLQAGVAAFQQGDESRARELLATAVEEGASHEDAHGYLNRLERLALGSRSSRSSARPTPRAPRAIDPTAERPHAAAPVRALPILVVMALAAAVIVFAASQDLLRPLVETSWGDTRPEVSSLVPADPLPLPRAAETAIGRARALYSTGRLRDALAVLRTVSPADPLAAEAERLRGQIQQALLEAAGLEPPPDGSGTTPGGRARE